VLAKTYNAVLIKPASQRRSHAGNPVLYLGVVADMHHYRRHSELQYWCTLYQTDIAYKSDGLAQEIAAMRAFMVCRKFSVNGGILACNGVIQGLPANGGGSRHKRRLILGHDRSYFISFIIPLGNETRCIREGQMANSHSKRDLGSVSR
jgi:hypothetical protein